MEKATKFVLIPFRDFRLLTCKRKINSKGRISGIVKEIEKQSLTEKQQENLNFMIEQQKLTEKLIAERDLKPAS